MANRKGEDPKFKHFPAPAQHQPFTHGAIPPTTPHHMPLGRPPGTCLCPRHLPTPAIRPRVSPDSPQPLPIHDDADEGTAAPAPAANNRQALDRPSAPRPLLDPILPVAVGMAAVETRKPKELDRKFHLQKW
ncbi:hypothetical protein PAPYR_12812 [Paratrimastix pyriformis]|uniref:Uncharacterized protein n=1 Tax=Paratrimastix pyriformis TaxID=342808 RepID=A0ABQ8U3Q7_9EUKA|nr:hypothetical protein PAPYR_12812 [Paratrimastix pyriformis]